MKHLSKERLESLKRQFIEDGYNDVRDSEVECLIDMALAGMSHDPLVPQSFGNSEQLEPVSQPYKFPDGIPNRIWLNTAGEWPEDGSAGEVAWCRDQQHELDTLYVRADSWIPCSERMPERGVDILACTISPIGGFEEIETAQWHGGMKGENPVFITSADTIDPTHWQPLPSPPKERGDA